MKPQDSKKILQPSPSNARMQLEEDKPVSELMVPNKMNEEEAEVNPEESKALDPNALARLNLGSEASARKP